MSNQDVLIEMCDGFLISKTLFAAVKFNIFTVLSNSEKSAAEISSAIDVPERTLERLLDVCVSMKLLNKKEGKYSNTELSEQYLVEGKPDYFGYYINARNNFLYSAFANIEDMIKEDRYHKAVEGKDGDIIDAVASNKEFARRAMMAQHNYSQEPAKDFAVETDLSDVKLMIDAGGGTGIFSVEAAKNNPNLKCIVFDRAFVLDVAKDIIAEHNVGDRVTIHPGDILKNPFPEGGDCVLISGILDGYAENECRVMLQKAYDYLPQGGKLILTECVISDDRSGPVFPALFSLLMVLRSKDGESRSRAEMTQWMSDTGFSEIKYNLLEKISGPYRQTGVLTGIKK